MNKGTAVNEFGVKWPALTVTLLRDIFNTHKTFIFGAFNCAPYKLRDFKNDIKKSKQNGFDTSNIVRFLNNGEFRSSATLFPSFLIHDDLFQVFDHIFAVFDQSFRVEK